MSEARGELIMPTPRVDGRQKLIVTLPVEDIAKLQELGERWGNRTTALIRAIRTIHYLVSAVSAGSKVVLHDRDGTRREILLAGENVAADDA